MLRSGYAAGVVAYVMWGLLPLYWPLLEPARPTEILAHRIVWSLLVVVALMLVIKGAGWMKEIERRQLTLLAAASVFVAINWGLFIYGVTSDRVVETSLGYFINPLVTVAFGMIVFRERLSPAQQAAVAIALVAVIVLTVDYGQPPWLALGLAFSWALYGLVKKRADVDALESLSIETAVLLLPAVAYLGFLSAEGTDTLDRGAGHVALLLGAGVATATPLLFFGAAAVRVPLVTLGLLQYIAPVMQFLIGVVVYGEAMPASRLVGFALVWIALIIFATDAARRSRLPVAAVPEPAT